MLDRRTTLVYLAAGAAVAGSAWITFVPDSVSGSTFGSILAVTIGLLVVSTTALRSSRSTRSAADVRPPIHRGYGSRSRRATSRPMYYGAADTSIALASGSIDELLHWLDVHGNLEQSQFRPGSGGPVPLEVDGARDCSRPTFFRNSFFARSALARTGVSP
jgi:hypothetical protein